MNFLSFLQMSEFLDLVPAGIPDPQRIIICIFQSPDPDPADIPAVIDRKIKREATVSFNAQDKEAQGCCGSFCLGNGNHRPVSPGHVTLPGNAGLPGKVCLRSLGFLCPGLVLVDLFWLNPAVFLSWIVLFSVIMIFSCHLPVRQSRPLFCTGRTLVGK
jgi:hypothetical protein